MLLNDNAPCKNCKERAMGCHGKCEKYQMWKSEHDKQKAEIQAKEEIANKIISSKIEFTYNYYKKTKNRRK